MTKIITNETYHVAVFSAIDDSGHDAIVALTKNEHGSYSVAFWNEDSDPRKYWYGEKPSYSFLVNFIGRAPSQHLVMQNYPIVSLDFTTGRIVTIDTVLTFETTIREN